MLGKWLVGVGVRFMWLWVGGFRCHMCGSYRNLEGELSRRCVFSYLCIVISCWMGREMVTEMFVGVLYMVSCCVSKCNGYAYR